MGDLYNPGAGLELGGTETEVFSGTSPTSWTDLDLAAVVGANVALVALKISRAGTAINRPAFRKNGDTDEFYAITDSMGCAFISLVPSGIHAVVLVVTDGSGLVEWRSAAADANVTIDVIGFIK